MPRKHIFCEDLRVFENGRHWVAGTEGLYRDRWVRLAQVCLDLVVGGTAAPHGHHGSASPATSIAHSRGPWGALEPSQDPASNNVMEQFPSRNRHVTANGMSECWERHFRITWEQRAMGEYCGLAGGNCYKEEYGQQLTAGHVEVFLYPRQTPLTL